MSASNKIIQAAAGNAAGEGLYVEDVFSTYLYTGNSSTQTITNGINLDEEGGLVWFKTRNVSFSGSPNHYLIDTERGVQKYLTSESTAAEGTDNNSLTSFNSNGFTVGSAAQVNVYDLASWTFRKAPKFFDVVTYTGTGVARTVAHNLGSVPGCIIVKCTSSSRLWAVYHRGHNGGTNPEDYFARLDGSGYGVTNNNTYWNDTAPTDSVFTVGTGANVNASGSTFVAYLFAHNDGDGEFGDDGDQDIIQCGSYTGNSSTPGALVDLGFEPQAVFIVSNTTGSSTKNVIFDSMRGTVTGGDDSYLSADLSNAEASDGNYMEFDSTGFRPSYDSQNYTNVSGNVYSYIAIRRGPMKTPESGTEVFEIIEDRTSIANRVNGSLEAVDLSLQTIVPTPSASYHIGFYPRLTAQNYLVSSTTAAESASAVYFDEQNGVRNGSWFTTGGIVYNFKRSPGFFDVVAYEGTLSSNSTSQEVEHNLGVVPEMIWTKRRDSTSGWAVYSPQLTAGTSGASALMAELNVTTYQFNGDLRYGNNVDGVIAPTSSVFTVGNFAASSGADYIAYLFATLPGVSKVGTYTGNGTSQTIDCGFTNGARFVLTKRIESGVTGNWNIWDSERGIVAGNDPRLAFNTASAEDTGHDYIDPDSSGFIVNYVADDDDDSNVSGDEYIFLAVS